MSPVGVTRFRIGTARDPAPAGRPPRGSARPGRGARRRRRRCRAAASTCSHAASTPARRSAVTRSTSRSGISTSGIAAASRLAIAGAGQHHHAGVDRARHAGGVPPAQQRVERVRRPGAKTKSAVPLPRRQRAQPGGHADPERPGPGEGAVAGERADLLDHRPDGQVAGPVPGRRLVAVDEEELVHAVRRGGQQVPPEAEQVAVAGVEAGDAPPAHRLDLAGDRDARHRRPAEVVVRHQERPGDRAEHPDLVPHPGQVRPRRRLDLAHQLEAHAHPTVRHRRPIPSLRLSRAGRERRRGAGHRRAGRAGSPGTWAATEGSAVPLTVREMIKMLERDGWYLATTPAGTGSSSTRRRSAGSRCRVGWDGTCRPARNAPFSGKRG